MDKDPLKVLMLTEVPNHASSCLRGYDPLKVLEGMGLVKFGVHSIAEIVDDDPDNLPESKKENIKKFAKDVDACDIILIPQTSALGWTKFISYWKSIGKIVVMDMDDDVRYVHPLSHTYQTRGIEEVTARMTINGEEVRVYLWQDGKNGFDIKTNKKWHEAYMNSMRTASAVTCPTQRFAETVRREINPVSFTLPNCIDTLMWKPGRHPGWPKDEFRICWHGGDSHRPDVGAAAAGLGRFLKTHPDAIFVMVGAPLAEWRAEVPQEQLEWWDWADYEAHPWRLMSLGLDLGLCPVAKHPFNDAKSPLKWEEFSALGVPAFASNCPPYSDAIRDGEDGKLVTDTPEEWEKALTWAYDNRESLSAMGARARARMEADFDLSKNAIQWYEVWSKLVTEKKASRIVTEVA